MSSPENPRNRVLSSQYGPSSNFFTSDRMFAHVLKHQLSSAGYSYMRPLWQTLGEEAAGRMNALSLTADKHAPELVERSPLGDTIQEIRFHPAYWDLMQVAVSSQMLRVKWEPGLKARFKSEQHALGFGSGFLFALSESGQYCPLCMTDGVARLLDMFGEEEDKKRLLPGIFTEQASSFLTGAMFLTEKSGGSDVGANLVKAEKISGSTYRLSGEKWFCSNVNADIIFVLARTDESIPGTRGLSIFLVEKLLTDGTRNPLGIIRLKDKLGVRSMASAECMLDGTIGKLVGKEFEGFKMMAEMMNLSRLYNSVAAVSAARRALIEAYQFLCHRNSFGKTAITHALIRTKLEELTALYTGIFYLLWRAIAALDRADNGDVRDAALLRLLTPMIKKTASETGGYLVRECMELMGGIGYIEDFVLPKIMRDILVLPIWEGAGNIMLLDMWRATVKSDGFAVMCAEIKETASLHPEEGKAFLTELSILQSQKEQLENASQDILEASSGPFFERLFQLYRDTVLLQASPDDAPWITLSLAYFSKKSNSSRQALSEPLSVEKIKAMMGWVF